MYLSKIKILEIIKKIKSNLLDLDFVIIFLEEVELYVSLQEIYNYSDIMCFIETFVSGKLGGKYAYINKTIKHLKSEFRHENKLIKKSLLNK